MYDILFIDDKFDEIQEIFFKLQRENIRCYFWDADEKKEPQDKTLFYNLSFICLDFFLENRGIRAGISEDITYSALARLIEPFLEINPKIEIIVNTSFLKEFNQSKLKKYLGNSNEKIGNNNEKSNLKEYLDKNNEIKISFEEKKEKFSELENHYEKIKKTSIPFVFRSLFLEQAIYIENLIYKKIKAYFKSKNQLERKEIETLLKNSQLDFNEKINIFNLLSKNNFKDDLNKLRKNRNTFAHGNNEKLKKKSFEEMQNKFKKFNELRDNIKNICLLRLPPKSGQ